MHKQLQAAVAAAVHKAYALLTQPPAAAAAGGASWQQQPWNQQQLLLQPQLQLTPQLKIAAATVSSYSLKLAKPLTSTDSKAGGGAAAAVSQHREGLLLKLTLSNACLAAADVESAAATESAAAGSFVGIGQAAPLPGLHTESFEQASQQLHMLTQLLRGLTVPQTLPLLGSNSITRWFRTELGLDPAVLYRSVRFAVESALLQALAAAGGCTLQELLLLQQQQSPSSSSSSVVQVNGLLPGSGSVEDVVAAGQALVAQGYKAIKVKVGRR
jgi:isochorismate synthase/2-succinyl-5-enolpyruvyl-6-hydroxy-3-cyclohexene-1-carboxylate synthase/2-succinyl-6-hydroxy-2,4-cyclohexadiene-1-carboxylate synthase/O-succinylbenzoate synthase